MEGFPAIDGIVVVPGDKSISHRAAMLASLAEGTSCIRGFLRAHDTMGTVSMMRSLGIRIREVGPTELRIEGCGLKGLERPDGVIDAGNSGTTMRIGSGILAGQEFETIITGDRYLRRRPMGRIIEPLGLMGARISGKAGDSLPPLTIRGGGLHGIRYTPAVASAQVKSAVLLAGLFADGRSTVIEVAPTRDHTERMLRSMGAEVSISGLEVTIEAPERLNPVDLDVPGDFSAAAFFLVLAASVPGAGLTLPGVGINPFRMGLIAALRRMGADLRIESEREYGGEPVADLKVSGRGLVGTDVTRADIPSMIDEIPALCVAAALARGRTEVRGAGELRVKESDRIGTMVKALSQLGVRCGEYPDGLWIEGPSPVRPDCRIDTRGDHRIAMSMRVLSVAARVPIQLSDVRCIETSFPDFEVALAALAG